MPIGKAKGLGFLRGGVDPAIALLNDGNTVGWYDYLTSSSITKDGSNLVSKWADILGSGNDLENTGLSATWPVLEATGITFSGASGCGLRTPSIASLIQPETIYLVAKQITYTSGRYIFDGIPQDRGELAQSGTSPNLAIYAGAVLNNNTATVGAFQVYTVVFNGANSLIQVNELAAVTGNAGAVNMAGFTIAAGGAANTTNFPSASNITVKGAVVRRVADNPTNRALIYAYLKNLYGI